MREDWYPGIKEFCSYWSHAPMLRQTLEALESEFSEENDGCIDAAKALVECACKVLIKELDDPSNPIKDWVRAVFRLMQLVETEADPFSAVISQHYKMTDALNDFRNAAGPLSHGKDGFIQRLSTHHRRSALLAADALITVLHQTYLERTPDPVASMKPYDRFQKSNEKIDCSSSFQTAEISDEGDLEVEVSIGNDERIPLKVTVSELLFGVDREAYKLAQNKTALVEIIPDEVDK